MPQIFSKYFGYIKGFGNPPRTCGQVLCVAGGCQTITGNTVARSKKVKIPKAKLR